MKDETVLALKNWMRFWSQNGVAFGLLILGCLVCPGGWVEGSITWFVGIYAGVCVLTYLILLAPVPRCEEAYFRKHELAVKFVHRQIGIPRIMHVVYDLGGALFLLGLQRYTILIFWLIQMLATFGIHNVLDTIVTRPPLPPKELNGLGANQENG